MILLIILVILAVLNAAFGIAGILQDVKELKHIQRRLEAMKDTVKMCNEWNTRILSSCEELKHGQKRIAEDVRTMVSHGSFLFSIEDDDLDDEEEPLASLKVSTPPVGCADTPLKEGELPPAASGGIPPQGGGQEEGAGGKADGAAGKAHGRRRSEDSERFRTLGEAIGADSPPSPPQGGGQAAESVALPVGCADTPLEEGGLPPAASGGIPPQGGGQDEGAEELRVDL
jgi:hypothetical protein